MSHACRCRAGPQPQLRAPGPIRRSSSRLRGSPRAFGPTLANAEIDLAVAAGDVIGLVGGNGAGKSTLMRILCGTMCADAGLDSPSPAKSLTSPTTTPAEAQRRGIRMVHQELSLCANLSVAENFFLETPERRGKPARLARALPGRARAALDAVFPGNAHRCRRRGRPSLHRRTADGRDRARRGDARRQADRARRADLLARSRALAAVARLHPERAQARAWPSSSSATSCRRSSTSPRESSCCATDASPGRAHVADASIGKLVAAHGRRRQSAVHQHGRRRRQRPRTQLVRLSGALTPNSAATSSIARGEIVGLAGLEGSGQKDLLHAIFRPGRKRARRHADRRRPASLPATGRRKACSRCGACSATSASARLRAAPALGLVSDRGQPLTRQPAPPASCGSTKAASTPTSWSSAAATSRRRWSPARWSPTTPIILLDDPTRGVDIATKQDFYRLCNEHRARADAHWSGTRPRTPNCSPATACWSLPAAGSSGN